MRLRVIFACAAFAVVMFAGCSGGQPQIGNEVTGLRPLGRPAPRPFPTVLPSFAPSWTQRLFVGNYFPNHVGLYKNWTWASDGSFTTTNAPWALWSDRQYLYIGHYIPTVPRGEIDQYVANNPTPIFQYTHPPDTPYAVTTQTIGGVHYIFAAGPGYVAEYKRGVNAIVASCTVPSTTVGFGVAVSPSGNVFVAYNNGASHLGVIDEYVGGLTGCVATHLGVTFPGNSDVAGMVLDNAGRLVVTVNNFVGAVDIINPPYNSVSGSLGSGYLWPVSVSINFDNNLAFVVDEPNQQLAKVWVLQYPSGAVVRTLTSADGITVPTSAVEWNNYGY